MKCDLKDCKDIIDSVVCEFYELATNDFLIGYHFRHIKNFKDHLPKIQRFWYIQLLDLTPKERASILKKETPKNVVKAHVYLKIKPGEIGRWVVLFKQVLANRKNSLLEKYLSHIWSEKIDSFREVFLSSPILF